ncbi:imidazole glycerol phosphate synthase subunit HisH [Emticicia sp.]|uniref:imidazole glycerol phosphate synthase subunit HisH n=1 Tax=Emticicia sp. TaxID=1930953 RepID=UPI0037539DC3
MIGIINYGSGNIYAIANLHKRLNIPYFLSENHEELQKADKLILPGVGAFDETMRMLHNSGLKSLLDELVLVNKVPIMGVCVGMQIMANGSEEGKLDGFGWIKGKVKKIDEKLLLHKPYIPHMGWNEINPTRQSDLFKNIDTQKGFYFLHSYYFSCENESDTLAYTNYGKQFSSVVNLENVYGVQFHPEKSHSNGINIFKNFANL